MLNIVTGKADVTFVDYTAGYLHNQSHSEHKLRNIADKKPLRMFPFSVAVKAGEFRLKNLLDQATQDVVYSGFVEKTVREQELYPGSLFLPAQPYKEFK